MTTRITTIDRNGEVSQLVLSTDDEVTVGKDSGSGSTEFRIEVTRDDLDMMRRYLDGEDRGTPGWRSDGEWVEVPIERAREGDYAEFDNTIKGGHEVGQLEEFGPKLFLGKTITPNTRDFRWLVRGSDGTMADGMENLHIWRRLDPHRFDEPAESGYYSTQSGILLYKDDDIHYSWSTGESGDVNFDYAEWPKVLEMLDDSEFPLVRVTRGMLAGAVGVSDERKEKGDGVDDDDQRQ